MKIHKIVITAAVSVLLIGCVPNTTPEPAPNIDDLSSILTPSITEPTTPANPTQPSQVVVPEPLSAGWMQQVEEDWFASTGELLGQWSEEGNDGYQDGVRYYGTYADYHIIFRPNGDDAITELQIASMTFSHNIGFELYAYQNGNFIPVKQLVEQGTLTLQDLGIINLRHKTYELQPSEGIAQLPTVTDDLYDTLKQMKLAFLRLHDTKDEHTVDDLSVIYYGEYNGAHVGFINGILMYTQALTSETVGGIIFRYNSGQKLLVYFEGELMGLTEAYDRGILTKDDLIKLHSSFTPKNDSFVTE